MHRRDEQAWALYSAATGVTMLATMGLAGAGFGQSRKLVGVGGFMQRVAIVTGFGWLTTICARALNAAPRSSR